MKAVIDAIIEVDAMYGKETNRTEALLTFKKLPIYLYELAVDEQVETFKSEYIKALPTLGMQLAEILEYDRQILGTLIDARMDFIGMSKVEAASMSGLSEILIYRIIKGRPVNMNQVQQLLSTIGLKLGLMTDKNFSELFYIPQEIHPIITEGLITTPETPDLGEGENPDGVYDGENPVTPVPGNTGEVTEGNNTTPSGGTNEPIIDPIEDEEVVLPGGDIITPDDPNVNPEAPIEDGEEDEEPTLPTSPPTEDDEIPVEPIEGDPIIPDIPSEEPVVEPEAPTEDPTIEEETEQVVPVEPVEV